MIMLISLRIKSFHNKNGINIKLEKLTKNSVLINLYLKLFV